MNAPFVSLPSVSPREFAKAIADRIEAHMQALDALIALLDALEGDPEIEPTLGAPERHPTPCYWGVGSISSVQGDQSMWADGGNSAPTDDAEAVNEDGDELSPGELSGPIPGGSDFGAASLQQPAGAPAFSPVGSWLHSTMDSHLSGGAK